MKTSRQVDKMCDLVFVNETIETTKKRIDSVSFQKSIEKQHSHGHKWKKLRFRKEIKFPEFMQNYFQFNSSTTCQSSVFKSVEVEMMRRDPNKYQTQDTLHEHTITESTDNHLDHYIEWYPCAVDPNTNKTRDKSSFGNDEPWDGLLPLVNVPEIMRDGRTCWYCTNNQCWK